MSGEFFTLFLLASIVFWIWKLDDYAAKYFLNKLDISFKETTGESVIFKTHFKWYKSEIQDISIAEYKPRKANSKANITLGKRLYVFMDPLCPLCKMIAPTLKNLADQSGYTINIIPFIIHGKPALKKVESFICTHKTFDDYVKGSFGESKPCSRSTRLLKNALRIGKMLGIRGTPTFVTSDGKMVVGVDNGRLKGILDIK